MYPAWSPTQLSGLRFQGWSEPGLHLQTRQLEPSPHGWQEVAAGWRPLNWRSCKTIRNTDHNTDPAVTHLSLRRRSQPTWRTRVWIQLGAPEVKRTRSRSLGGSSAAGKRLYWYSLGGKGGTFKARTGDVALAQVSAGTCLSPVSAVLMNWNAVFHLEPL